MSELQVCIHIAVKRADIGHNPEVVELAFHYTVHHKSLTFSEFAEIYAFLSPGIHQSVHTPAAEHTGAQPCIDAHIVNVRYIGYAAVHRACKTAVIHIDPHVFELHIAHRPAHLPAYIGSQPRIFKGGGEEGQGLEVQKTVFYPAFQMHLVEEVGKSSGPCISHSEEGEYEVGIIVPDFEIAYDDIAVACPCITADVTAVESAPFPESHFQQVSSYDLAPHFQVLALEVDVLDFEVGPVYAHLFSVFAVGAFRD